MPRVILPVFLLRVLDRLILHQTNFLTSSQLVEVVRTLSIWRRDGILVWRSRLRDNQRLPDHATLIGTC